VTIWRFTGTENQRRVACEAMARFDFPWDLLCDSLIREGRSVVEVAWADLSRYSARGLLDHDHHVDGAHPIIREVDGRLRVLGLFYLPPHTRVVLDVSLEHDPELAAEVAGAEAAHAVDYHWLAQQPEPRGRWGVTNLLHRDDLVPGHPVHDGVAFTLDGHTCSWFDVGSYADWTGEAMMELFVEAFSDVVVTIALNHPTSPEVARTFRQWVLEASGDASGPGSKRVFAKRKGNVAHDSHDGIEQARWWDSLAAAQADGMRACRTCKP
jgi:hypothetical protein